LQKALETSQDFPMPRDTLTGSRIRERRVMAGIKQSDLAKRADISPSYLNLIEHNRRRIGGKLLVDIAHALGVEPTSLTEGAETTLLATLREAATDTDLSATELSRVEEFAGRFPGWAALLADSQRKIESLQQSVEALTDRLTHDPHLAASLHEMLSTVTAIRSAASILVEPGDIEPEWQRRFNRNIYEDSARLADTSRSLAQYLEEADSDAVDASAPQDELDGVFQRIGFHLPQLEANGGNVEAVVQDLSVGLSQSAQWLLHKALSRYAKDARKLPLALCARIVPISGSDPVAFAELAETDIAMAMRRLAHLPESVLSDPVGLAICDASGVITFRKPLPEFPLPRLGAGCALWPLYSALNRPMMALEERVEQSTRTAAHHRVVAIAQPAHRAPAGKDVLFESHMLIIPESKSEKRDEVVRVGLTCRICPEMECIARREPSILVAPDMRKF
jgi:transcriptional regulator with XRE-family HTH domain